MTTVRADVRPPLVVIHERIGNWHRRLRPRFLGLDPTLRWVESRSGSDLETILRGEIAPILVVDLGDRPTRILGELARGLDAAPGALALALDPCETLGLAPVARELGAAHVISGPARPPEVEGWVARWLSVARERDASEGWARPIPLQAEPWDDPDAFAARWLANARWARR